MTTKELKKLHRAELVQLLLDLVQENEQLKSQVHTLTVQVNQQRITCEKAGSIAEAALALSNIFQDADQVARKYLQEVEMLTAQQEQELQEKAAQARQQADKVMADAFNVASIVRKDADAYLANAKAEAAKILENARAEANAHKQSVSNEPWTLPKEQGASKPAGRFARKK